MTTDPKQPRCTRAGTSRRVIVNADDFGLHTAVNEAVVQAHQHGILTSASLMVAAPAAGDAVVRAKTLPNLGVGLHLVLADGYSCLPPARIPDLVAVSGRFDDNMVRAGMRFFFTRKGRAQLAAEIEAQFAAFAETGLALDHVNAHKHFHLHPTILDLIIRIGQDYGLKAVRLPYEPWQQARQLSTTHSSSGRWSALGLKPWVNILKARLDKAGLIYNDQVLGLGETGHMVESTVQKVPDVLPTGLTEVYFHPATRNGITPSMVDYDHVGELGALISPQVIARFSQPGIQCLRFTDID